MQLVSIRKAGWLTAIWLTAGLAPGCAPPSTASSLRSFLGLEAGQNDAVRDGNAPTFVALSDWFQNFSIGAPAAGPAAAGAGAKRNLPFSAVSGKVPAASQTALVGYVDQQLARTAALQAALSAGNDQQLKSLFDTETAEMYDIVMVMLNRRYQPQTQDLFARFLASSRNVDYVHVFALDFLEQVLKTRLLTDVQASLSTERLNYLKALSSLYLDSDASRAKLAADLSTNVGTLNAMRQALAGGAGLGLDDSDGSDSGPATGSAATLAQYALGLRDYEGDLGAGLPSSILSAAQGDPTETQFAGGGPAGAAASDPSGAAASDPSGASADSAGATAAASGDANASFDPSIAGTGAAQLLDDDAIAAIIPHAPPIDCTKKGLSGKALITCQFHFAYAQTVIHPGHYRTAPAAGLALASDDSANVQTLQDANTSTLDQGEEPSCTAQSLSYAFNGYLNGGVAAADRSAAFTPSTPSCDPEALWANQGEVPDMGTAISSAQQNGGCGGANIAAAPEIDQNYGSSADLTAAPSVDQQIMQAIDNHGVVYIGLNLDDSWNGGGPAVDLDDGGPAVYGCDPNGPGHAVIVTGYMHDAAGNLQLATHNSWGDSWGDNGYGLIDYNSCISVAEIYLPTFKPQP